MSTFNDDRSFYIARLSTRMFDSVAKHVEENKPSGWTIVDDTNIDYTDENLKITISIFSSKDAVQVLVNWGEDHSNEFTSIAGTMYLIISLPPLLSFTMAFWGISSLM